MGIRVFQASETGCGKTFSRRWRGMGSAGVTPQGHLLLPWVRFHSVVFFYLWDLGGRKSSMNLVLIQVTSENNDLGAFYNANNKWKSMKNLHTICEIYTHIHIG